MRSTDLPRYDLSARSFAAICAALRLCTDPRPIHSALRSAWRESQRCYHRTYHLRSCLQLLQRWQVHAAQPNQIALALWFHDAIYEPQSGHNEARSADWAAQVLADAGASTELKKRIVQLILATAHGSFDVMSDQPDGDRDLLLDIDLAILGATRADYTRYRWQIRREYAWVAPQVYRDARAGILRAFLRMPAIYRSNCAAHLEALARGNLQTELVILTGDDEIALAMS
jgi:predicted metal-dependent HD superfamily phosphohydrolase